MDYSFIFGIIAGSFIYGIIIWITAYHYGALYGSKVVFKDILKHGSDVEKKYFRAFLYAYNERHEKRKA